MPKYRVWFRVPDPEMYDTPNPQSITVHAFVPATNREQILNEAGTNPNLAVTKHNKANIYYLYISGRIQALKVANYMYQDATLWMPRKRKVIESWPKPQKRYRNAKGQYI